MKRALWFTILGTAALAACEGDGLGPRSGDLSLEASITRTVVSPDNPASIVFRVRNDGADTITLLFDGCRILFPYITTAAGDTVMPDGGDWGCSQVQIAGLVTTLTLAPGV